MSFIGESSFHRCREEMKSSTLMKLSAGQLDAGLASIATFAAGLFAVWEFEPTLLGAYVVTFTAWNLARTLASEMVFVPSEVVAVGHHERVRLRILDSSVRRGLAVSSIGALGVLLSMFLIETDVGTETALALTISGSAVALLAPLHEHWRTMFHIAGTSWRAVVISTVHLTVSLAAFLLLYERVNPAWIPFGALAMGFLASSFVAVAFTLRMRTPTTKVEQPPWSELTKIGRWLLVANASAMGSDFLLVLLARSVIGSELVGYAEGARVVARPVIILGIGLAAVLGPRSVRAGLTRDRDAARRTRRIFWAVGLFVSFSYLAVVGFDWQLNPLPDLIPTAYAVDGLVAVAIIGTIFSNIAFPWWHESLGGRRQRLIAASEVAGSVAKVMTGLLAPILQAFVFPVAWASGWFTRAVGLWGTTRSLYTEPDTLESAGAKEPPM